MDIEISIDLDCTNAEMEKLCEQYLHYGYTADFYKTTKETLNEKPTKTKHHKY